jgi:hypothetical protein
VVHCLQVGKFVGNNVVNDCKAKLNKPPVQTNMTVLGAASPTGAGMGNGKPAVAAP